LAAADQKLSWFNRAKYTAVRSFLYGIVKYFGLEGLYQFGQFFGYCEYLLQYNRRKRLYRLLDKIYGPNAKSRKDKRRVARRQTCRLRCDKMLYTVIDRLDRQVLLDRVHSENIEHFDQALQRGKGMFLMFSHQGAHHLAGILLTLMGYRINGIRDPKQSVLRQYVQRQFEQHFPEFKELNIAFSGDFARPFFRTFRTNGIVAAAMDVRRDRGDNVRTVPVEIFGGQQQFISGMTQIALRCRATIITGFMLSEKDYHFRMIIHPPLIDPDTAADDAQTVQQVMQKYADLIEQHVKEYPWNVSKTR